MAYNFKAPNEQMHPQDRRNLIIFIIASLVIYLSFDHFILQPKINSIRQEQLASQGLLKQQGPGGDATVADKVETRDHVVASSQRIKMDNGTVFGTIAMTGNRIDDVMLHKYFKTLGGKDNVEVMMPAATEHPKYAEFGWVSDGNSVKVPDKDTSWSISGNRELSKDHPVTMSWANGQGQVFERTLSMDDQYVITVTQRVRNTGAKEIKLFPYALIAGVGLPANFAPQSIVHEGAIGYIGDKLHQSKYKKLDEEGEETFSASKGWVGITEKYWLTSLIPAQNENVKYSFKSTPAPNAPKIHRYQVDIMGGERTIAVAGTAESTVHLFAGAKEVRVLDAYEQTLDVPHFDLAVDFGLYYFLTKPFFFILSLIGHMTGNFGVAIVIFTFILRAAMYPLNNTSYRSFAKLKKVGPEMNALRDKYKDDKAALQKELVALYTREKVNPAAGCLPIVLQIPIFFALYKVLSVTIEMRHAPFFGWIHDLSIADPTTVFNLFGLIHWPFALPAFLMIGAWPCMMLLSMLLQRSMNPPPQDPVQAQMMRLMPFFMTFVMAKFAAGLVIYWTVSNILSVAQQYIISRRMGVEVNFFGRSKADQELEDKVIHGPSVHPELEMIEGEIEDALSPVTPPKGRRKKKR
jgi:YidC/Oxa1 family membrane protein insertase